MFTYSFFLSNPCKFIFAARSGQARIWLTRGGFKEVIHGTDTSGRSRSTVTPEDRTGNPLATAGPTPVRDP